MLFGRELMRKEAGLRLVERWEIGFVVGWFYGVDSVGCLFELRLERKGSGCFWVLEFVGEAGNVGRAR